MPFEADDNFFRALPKAELHAHLSGSIDGGTLHELWLHKRSDNQCLDLEDPLTAIRAGSAEFVDINTFFPLFDKYIYALCNNITSVKYATERVIEGFEKDGVRYLELRTTPRECIATGMSTTDYVEAVVEVISSWNAINSERIEVYLILSIDRKVSAEQAEMVVDLAIRHQRRPENQSRVVVAVDLCGNPTKGDVSTFTAAFLKASSSGLGITIHFAEVPQSSTEVELDTILSWKPDRLGHCIHAPAKTIDMIEKRKVAVELCLSCNVLGKLTFGGYSNHHLGQWLDRSCPIAISTDDVGIFGSPLSREYAIAARNFLNTKADVVRLCRSAVEAAFTGRRRMTKLIDSFEKDSVYRSGIPATLIN